MTVARYIPIWHVSVQLVRDVWGGRALFEYITMTRFNVGAYPIGEPELIYAPWWLIEYRVGGRSYSVIVDASCGQVVAGRRPWIPKGIIRRGRGVSWDAQGN